MGGGDGGEWWKPSGVGPVCRVGEECARRAREQKERRISLHKKVSPIPVRTLRLGLTGLVLLRIVAVAVWSAETQR
ncbi:hypothetical protein ACS0PU_008341 [Formica fusca]